MIEVKTCPFAEIFRFCVATTLPSFLYSASISPLPNCDDEMTRGNPGALGQPAHAAVPADDIARCLNLAAVDVEPGEPSAAPGGAKPR
jgi:hypothetical protein